jgi:transcriptional regulator with GAF, ATPase, and Fis domain
LSSLIIVEGEQRRVVPLREEVVTIGRARDSLLCLDDQKASRRHCRIEKTGRGYCIVDAGSQNGTYLNGELVTRRVLAKGDRIDIGSVRIHFEEERKDGEPSRTQPIPDPEETQSGEGPSLKKELARLKRERGRLLRLVKVSEAVNSELHPERLLELVMDAMIEITDAERGFLILMDKGRLDFKVARRFDQEAIEKPEFDVSWSIAAQVCRTGEPVVIVNAQGDDRFKATQSVEQLGLRSVICVPFAVQGKILGTAYLDNRLHKGIFSEDDLYVLEAFAHQAAVALERARLVQELRESHDSILGLNEELQRQIASDGVVRNESAVLPRPGPGRSGTKYDYRDIIGGSRRMVEMFRLLDKVVETDVPVLIQGESGTGKELVARAIHYSGPLKDRPFVSENCAALPDTLLESELFGHVKGSFTGASRDKKGLFEVAHGGTLFLDEVGEMSPDMQKKLLRALQEGEIRPVGGKDTVKVDVRLLSASNRDLTEMVGAGEFREDLFYRLRVLTVELPPLRERIEDLPALARFFLEKYTDEMKTGRRIFDGDVLGALAAHRWPGNVRELENEIKRLVALSDHVITTDLLSPGIVPAGAQRKTSLPSDFGDEVHDLTHLVEDVETREIIKALECSDGNKTRAAEMLGISRFTLQRKLEKYGIG